jgi:DNA-binding FrmR family transcriptional regulator
MAHTIHNKDKLLTRIKKLQGQLNAVSSLVEKEEDCYKILQTLASCRGALNGLMGEIVEGHVMEHIVGADKKKNAKEAGTQLIQIMNSFWR